jgi:hypothetical protein
VVALVLWLLGSIGFSWYVDNFGKYNQTYGALAAVIILLLWLFLSAFVVLLGAELDAETDVRRPGTPPPARSGRWASATPRSPTPRRKRAAPVTAPAGRHPHLPPGPRKVGNWEGAYALPEPYVAALGAAGPGSPCCPRPSRPSPRSCWPRSTACCWPAGGDIEPARYGAADHPAQYGTDPDRDELELELATAAARLACPRSASAAGSSC